MINIVITINQNQIKAGIEGKDATLEEIGLSIAELETFKIAQLEAFRKVINQGKAE